MSRRGAVLLAAGGSVLCCCLAVVGVAGGIMAALSPSQELSTDQEPSPPITSPTGTPQVEVEEPPTLAPNVLSSPASEGAYETLEGLRNTLIPIRDAIELAQRFKGVKDIPLSLLSPPKVYRVGDSKQFWITDVDANRNYQVTAVLRYIGQNHYFWVEKGVNYRAEDLQRLGETFDQSIYPTTRSFFGSEWSPGVDNDPRVYILFARGLGVRLAGYFSSSNSVNPLAHPYSNAHELFLLNADTVTMMDDYTYGVLAHELQHMIQWNQDRNEEVWLNEGFSELAVFLNGYYRGGFDRIFTRRPDVQLNDWPNDQDATTPNYGASFLFVTYFLDRFGEQATRALVTNPLNGLDSVDASLEEIGVIDPVSGQPILADDVFSDWTLANYLKDQRIGDGRYGYSIYPDSPRTRQTEKITRCPMDWQERAARQYGVHYITIRCEGSFELQFSGASATQLLPADPNSGQYAYWSNKGDESNMSLTRTFDFQEISGPLTLRYAAWFDLERDYDYLYLTVSEDGENWKILTTPSGTAENPSGNSYGWGYTSISGGWIQEEVDLSQYAGKKIHLRFEYVTDAAVNGEGFLLDDVAIQQTGYFEDFEAGDGGWLAQGFARVQNRLPQTFRLSLVKMSEIAVVELLLLDDDQTSSVRINFGDGFDEVVLVVSGTTRYTRQHAGYSFRIVP